MPMLSRILPLLALGALVACGTGDGVSGDAGGTMIITVGAEPDALLPITTTSVAGNQVADIIFERLAEPGDEMNTNGDGGFVPELAESWTWAPDSLSIAFKVHPGAKWHDGAPVTARDVAFSFDIHKDPEVGSSVLPLLSRIDSVTVRDSMTAVVWYRQRYPEQFLDAAFQVRIHPEHWLGKVKRSEYTTSPVVRSPVGSGRFKFVRWEPGTLVEVVAEHRALPRPPEPRSHPLDDRARVHRVRRAPVQRRGRLHRVPAPRDRRGASEAPRAHDCSLRLARLRLHVVQPARPAPHHASASRSSATPASGGRCRWRSIARRP